MDHYKHECDCVAGVGCDAYNCKYNDNECKRCTAEHIMVENKAAMSKSETFCGTFAPKTGY